MASTAALSQSVSVELAGGGGTVSAGPTGFGEVWQNVTVAVHCATNVSEATCRIYVGGGPSAQYFADGTTWGSTGDSSNNMPPTIVGGQNIYAVWSGGDDTTTAYLTVTGTRTVA
jgi:hypothetical protein